MNIKDLILELKDKCDRKLLKIEYYKKEINIMKIEVISLKEEIKKLEKEK